MRTIALLLVAFTPLLPARTKSQALAPTMLVGRWAGSGTFFNRDLQARVGPLPFVAEFTTDSSGTGRVGKATMQDVRVVRSTPELIEIRAKLAGFAGQDPALAKDRLVLVITKLDASTIEAEFHLKSNFTYDPSMREGRVRLTRIPSPDAPPGLTRKDHEPRTSWARRCCRYRDARPHRVQRPDREH